MQPYPRPGAKVRGLDRFDAAILEQLQRNARTTAEAMADVVGLSAAACQKRMRALRQSGRIGREVAVLGPEFAAARLTLVLQVTLYGEKSATLAAFADRMREADEVMQCYRITGAAHFILIVTAPDMEAFNAFCERSLNRHGEVERLLTSVVRERIKTSFFQPVVVEPTPGAEDGYCGSP